MSQPQARDYMLAAAPRASEVQLVSTGGVRHLFVADGSRLFEVDEDLFAGFDKAMKAGEQQVLSELLREAGLSSSPYIDDTPLEAPTVHALSLAVAQKCNLGCSYCYAQQGEFGGPARSMPLQTALDAVDMLTGQAPEGAKLNLAFLGGEPLVARDVLREATRHAVSRAKSRGQTVNFSITTNGTLIRPDDGAFFEEHGFAVTISLDGTRSAHDAQRPYRNGRGSFDAIMERVAPLLAAQRRMQVSALTRVASST